MKEGANLKYHFTDPGLRNARLNFRQQEPIHIMENIVYNELLIRGYNVNVDIVQIFDKDKEGKRVRKQLEIDFLVNQGSKKPWRNNEGFVIIGMKYFLLNADSLEF